MVEALRVVVDCGVVVTPEVVVIAGVVVDS